MKFKIVERFGWISIFFKKRENEDWDGQIKVHDGIKIKKHDKKTT